MSQKIFLTSAIAMGFVAPAMAEPTYTSETFPSTGLMQEDYTYKNAATATNMDSVYEGTVNATAEYEDIFYDIVAGNYLAAGSDDEDGTICPAGSYCSGLTHAPYNATENQGITSCPTIDDATFTSVAGSSAVTACYQEDSAMSTATLNPFTTAHLDTSVSGNGYTNGVKYAKSTTTARRYATTATTAGEWAALDESDLAITDLACENGYHYKAGTTGPNLTSLIGITEAADDYGHKSNSGTGNNYNEDKYGITQNGEFVVDYGSKGKIHGYAQCSTRAGAANTYDGTTYHVIDSNFTATLPDSSGKYCYCQLDSYTPVSGSATALSAPWVFYPDIAYAGDCANRCANYCVSGLRNNNQRDLAFRAAVFGVIPSNPTMCEANTITINWSNADAEDISANNAGTATYGSDVRTPVKAETIKGKTFKGWRFSKPEQTPLL